MKYLLVLAVVWLAFYLWRNQRQQARPASRRAAPRMAQATVACAHCGLHVPQTEAVARGGRWFCCAAHADAGVAQPAAGDRARQP